MAVVKANAYGHGLLPTALALADADAFAVARLEEAVALRAARDNEAPSPLKRRARLPSAATAVPKEVLVETYPADADVTARDVGRTSRRDRVPRLR